MTVIVRPRLCIEGAFQSTASGSLLWSDLTDYLDLGAGELNIAQRRQTLFDEPTSGTLSFSVDNSTGNFTDTNASSPFYPGITQNTPLRARVQWPVTDNILSGPISRTDDENVWTAEQGELDTSITSPAAGVTSSVTWDTGVLDQTDIRVILGNGTRSMPGAQPVYVKAGEVCSARIALKLPTGTLSCALHITWLNAAGAVISEVASSTVALSSSWQTLSITNTTAPANTAKAVLSISNETTVLPASRTITYVGGNSDPDQWSTQANLRIPDTAQAGDIALMVRRTANGSATFDLPSGWTFINTYSDARGKTRYDYKILNSRDKSATITATQDLPGRLFSSIVVYRNINQATPIHQNASSADTTYHATRTCASVTTSINNCMIMSSVFDSATTTSTITKPAALALRESGFCLKGWAPSGVIADIILATAGATGTRAFTSNVASKSASISTIALAPGTGTGPGNVTVYIGAPMLVKAASLPAFVAGGNWSNLITAYADSWEDTWQLDKPSVGVTATDRSKLLNEIDIFSPLRETIMDADPILYYRLYEADGAVEGSDHSIYSQPSVEPIKANITTLTYGWRQGKKPPRDYPGIHLVQQTVTNGVYLQAENLDTAVGDGSSVSAFTFFSSDFAGAAEVTLLKIAPTSGSKAGRSLIELFAYPGSYVGCKARIISDTTEVYPSKQTSINVFDGETHCIGMTAKLSGGFLTVTLYVDGIPFGSTSTATTFTEIPALTAICIGGAYNFPGRLADGVYHNVAAYNSALSDEDFANVWGARTTGYAGETCSERMYRIMGWEDLSGMDIGDSYVIIGGIPSDNSSTLLESLQLTADTDGGTVFINGNDEVKFISAATKQSRYAPFLTLGAGDLAEPPSATKNDELLVNDITVNRLSDGTSQRLQDSASIAKYGRHAKSIDTLLNSNAAARHRAGYFIAFFSQPITRFDSVSIECLLQADWTNLVAAGMWDILRITGLPSTAPATQLDSFIEGREWSISADSWRLTFDVSYAIPFAIVGDATRGLTGTIVVGK